MSTFIVAEYPYLAGIIDGDGSINIERVKCGTARPHAQGPTSSRGYIYRPNIRISQPENEAVALAQKHFGGSICACTTSTGNKINSWSVTSRSAYNVARQLQPYLRVRAPQAEMILRLADITSKRTGGTGPKYSNEQWVSMDALYDEYRKGNFLSPQNPLPASEIYPYLAGVIDSDGCIIVKKRDRASPHWAGTKSLWHCEIQICQSNPTVPKMAKQVFGGSVSIDYPHNPPGLPRYKWRVGHQLALNASKKLLPYLRIKRVKAEKLIEHYEGR